MTDTISISDRMSSNSPSITSLNQIGAAAAIKSNSIPTEPGHTNPRTTTISTIAVQCLNCRMVVALLQSRDILTLRVLESSPSFHTIGENAQEAEEMLKEHMNVLTKLQNIESPVEELLRRVDASLVTNPNPEVYHAMAESLGQAWKDLNGMLDRRRELLELGAKFHTKHKECLAKLNSSDNIESVGRRGTLKMYAEANELGKRILEHMSAIEDGALSVAQVQSMLEELWLRLTQWKQELQIKQRSANEENLFESLQHELDEIVKMSDSDPEVARRKLLLLISRLEDIEFEFSDKSKLDELITRCYEQLDKLNQKLVAELNLNQFLLDNKQLHADSFKIEHEQRLRELGQATGEPGIGPQDVDRKELVDIFKTRLNIRNEYEYLLENVMNFQNDEEIRERLATGLPASGGLEIDGALLILKEKREQLENDLYYKFKPQIDSIEQCLHDIGEIGTLKSLLEKTYQIQADIANAPKFSGKDELERACEALIHQLEAKINILYSVHQFLFENRELTQPDFQRHHEEQLLKVVYELHNHELESRFHTRLGLRQLYDEMLHVPLEYDEEQVEHLLQEDPTLDVRQAIQNYRRARQIDELLATLDFPLPENLATARNDLEDFKSFENIIQSLPNPTDELLEKSKTKKENILKCIELYEILERVERFEYITRIEQLEMELFGSSTYADAIQEEHRRNAAAADVEIGPPVPPPPSDEALYSKVIAAGERDWTKSPSPALSIIEVPLPLPRPQSASIETQTEHLQLQYGPPQSPPPLMNPFQAEAFVQQTEHLITEILDRREQQQVWARAKTPQHEMETQTFEPQPIELSNEETQTTMLLLLPAPALSDEGCQTDDAPEYDFIAYSPPAVFSPPSTPGIESETQTNAAFMKPAETQTFTYQVLANRQTQTPVEFIRALIPPPVPPPKPKKVFSAETQTTPPPPEKEPLPVAAVVERCEVDTQTVECPRFLAHMETQTLDGGEQPEPEVVTTTREQVHTYIHERIEQVHETAPFHDQGSQAGAHAFQQEMETQTTVAIPIIEPSSSHIVLPQSPQIAKILSNTGSQTDTQHQVLSSAALHEMSSDYKPSEQQISAEARVLSPPVFADLQPQLINLEFDVTSRAQEICLASEEVCDKANFEGPLVPRTPASTPVDEKMMKQFTATPYQPIPDDSRKQLKQTKTRPEIETEIPISIGNTTPVPQEKKTKGEPIIKVGSTSEALQPQPIAMVSESYETKSSIFEQSYVLESTPGATTQGPGDTSMMDKGSGTPLSKVSDRVRAWEIYQNEPEPVPSTKPAVPPKPGLRPSSISDYRLLFQSPSPTPTDQAPGASSINEACKKFEDTESTTTRITETKFGPASGVGVGQKPSIPEKPKRIFIGEQQQMPFSDSKVRQQIPSSITGDTSVSSCKRLFETYEQTHTETITSTLPLESDQTTPPHAGQDYDTGIVSKFKQFFQSHDQQPKPTSMQAQPQPQPVAITYEFPVASTLTRTSQGSTSMSTTRTHTKIQEMVRPSKFVPVAPGEWSEQSDYESDLEAYKIQPIWVPPSQRDSMSPKFHPFSPPPAAAKTAAQQPQVVTQIPIVRASAFTSVPGAGAGLGVKPVPPPKPVLSPTPGSGAATDTRSAFEKPIIAPKPQIASPKPGTAPIVVPLPYESKQTSLTSTLTKTEETKFLMRPVKSPEPATTDPDLRVTRRLSAHSPEYFVSITAPPITATTTAIEQSKDGTIRKLYETTTKATSSSVTTTKRMVEETGGGAVEARSATSPDMEPYYQWRETAATSPFYPLQEQPGFYSSREETPTPVGEATGKKSVETMIPIERETADSKVTILKPEPILKTVEVKPKSESDDHANAINDEQQPAEPVKTVDSKPL